ncbi:hypothetical protein Apmu_0011_32 [Acidiphilium multivorum AIU301]|nr:hypothetical protein Apmu_0011_32 [Acidiphilium multivorum AIU301]
MTPFVQQVAARKIERQAEAEHEPLPDLGHSLENLFPGDQVETPPLIVGSEIAPVRSLRPMAPARFRHVILPYAFLAAGGDSPARPIMHARTILSALLPISAPCGTIGPQFEETSEYDDP